MGKEVLHKLCLGFIRIQILKFCSKNEFYGLLLMEKLESSGYSIQLGNLYLILNKMKKENLLFVKEKNIKGSIRKYYTNTPLGDKVLMEAKIKIEEFTRGSI